MSNVLTQARRAKQSGIALYSILEQIMQGRAYFITYDMDPPCELATITIPQSVYNEARDILSFIKGDAE